jgi:hypothetical protein
MSTTAPRPAAQLDVSIRPLESGDLDVADRLMRIAFGTFLGAPDPITVFGDLNYVRSRFAAAPTWAFAAVVDGEWSAPTLRHGGGATGSSGRSP